MDALTQLKGSLFGVGALIFVLYPLVVLAWTVAEGRASSGASLVGGGRWPVGKAGRGSKASTGDDRAQAGCRRRAEKEAACDDCCKSLSTAGAGPPASPRAGGLAGVLEAALLEDWLLRGAVLCAGSWRSLRYAATASILAVRFIAYCLLLSPWFLAIGFAYFRSQHIRRGIRVGPSPRNLVDIICPAGVAAAKDSKAPVVIAVMGGAWVIGHRLWNALLALRLAEAGVMVVAVDYRNFPSAQMHEMVEDVGCALDWVFANIEEYGGDRQNIALIGQSAGAHLSAMVLLERSMAEARAGCGEKPRGTWSVGELKGFVGVSGVYDMVALVPHLEARGLYSYLHHMCAGGDLVRCSPTRLLRAAAPPRALAALPPVRLFHGGADCSVPASSSAGFAEALAAAGFQAVSSELRPGLRHVSPVVEDPLAGGDLQVRLVLPLLLGDEETERRLASLPPPWPRAPRLLVAAVSPIMPF